VVPHEITATGLHFDLSWVLWKLLSSVRVIYFFYHICILTNSIAGALFLFSCWYTKKELATRISVLYAAGQMAGAFGGLLAAGIMSGMDGKLGLPSWRWLCKYFTKSICGVDANMLVYKSSLKDQPRFRLQS